MFCAPPGSGMPATAAAAAAADCLTNSLRVIVTIDLFVHRRGALGVLVDQRRGEHAVDAVDLDDGSGNGVASSASSVTTSLPSRLCA